MFQKQISQLSTVQKGLNFWKTILVPSSRYNILESHIQTANGEVMGEIEIQEQN